MKNSMHYKKWAKRSLVGIIGLIIIIGGMSRFVGLPGGTRVFAQREKNIWYSGKIDGTCSGGYNVTYDRGAQQCLTSESIIKDVVPSKDDIKVGTNIIAQWKGEPLYNAKVIEIIGDQFKVEYYDTVKNTINIDELRLLKE
ncbi:MAG: hypothetical protein NTX63_04230 [Candidatus Peregrinibacteria bacterium]|nr:hypothetical protein [Candidatus Peregrinibacteria bacterium]